MRMEPVAKTLFLELRLGGAAEHTELSSNSAGSKTISTGTYRIQGCLISFNWANGTADVGYLQSEEVLLLNGKAYRQHRQ